MLLGKLLTFSDLSFSICTGLNKMGYLCIAAALRHLMGLNLTSAWLLYFFNV